MNKKSGKKLIWIGVIIVIIALAPVIRIGYLMIENFLNPGWFQTYAKQIEGKSADYLINLLKKGNRKSDVAEWVLKNRKYINITEDMYEFVFLQTVFSLIVEEIVDKWYRRY
jgi:hypothetical protein